MDFFAKNIFIGFHKIFINKQIKEKRGTSFSFFIFEENKIILDLIGPILKMYS